MADYIKSPLTERQELQLNGVNEDIIFYTVLDQAESDGNPGRDRKLSLKNIERYLFGFTNDRTVEEIKYTDEIYVVGDDSPSKTRTKMTMDTVVRFFVGENNNDYVFDNDDTIMISKKPVEVGGVGERVLTSINSLKEEMRETVRHWKTITVGWDGTNFVNRFNVNEDGNITAIGAASGNTAFSFDYTNGLRSNKLKIGWSSSNALSTKFNVDEDGKTFIKVRPTNDLSWDLAIGKYFNLYGSDSNESYLLHNAYWMSDEGGWRYRESTTGAGANYIRMGGGLFGFFVADDGTQDANITWKEALSIAKTGVSTFGYNVICNSNLTSAGNLYSNGSSAYLPFSFDYANGLKVNKFQVGWNSTSNTLANRFNVNENGIIGAVGASSGNYALTFSYDTGLRANKLVIGWVSSALANYFYVDETGNAIIHGTITSYGDGIYTNFTHDATNGLKVNKLSVGWGSNALSTKFNVDEDGKTFIKVRPTNDYYWDLALGKYFTLRGSDSDESYLLHNAYWSFDEGDWRYRESTVGAGANYIRMGGGLFVFFVADDGVQDASIIWKEALSIAKTGNATFSYNINISGNIYSNGSSAYLPFSFNYADGLRTNKLQIGWNSTSNALVNRFNVNENGIIGAVGASSGNYALTFSYDTGLRANKLVIGWNSNSLSNRFSIDENGSFAAVGSSTTTNIGFTYSYSEGGKFNKLQIGWSSSTLANRFNVTEDGIITAIGAASGNTAFSFDYTNGLRANKLQIGWSSSNLSTTFNVTEDGIITAIGAASGGTAFSFNYANGLRTNKLQIGWSSSTLNTYFNVDTDGKTFIKTRPSNDYYWNLALGKFFTLCGYDNNESYLLHNAYWMTEWRYRESTTGAGANYVNMAGGIFEFYVADDGVKDSTITWKQALSIWKTGVSTFGYAVIVNGNIYSKGTSSYTSFSFDYANGLKVNKFQVGWSTNALANRFSIDENGSIAAIGATSGNNALTFSYTNGLRANKLAIGWVSSALANYFYVDETGNAIIHGTITSYGDGIYTNFTHDATNGLKINKLQVGYAANALANRFNVNEDGNITAIGAASGNTAFSFDYTNGLKANKLQIGWSSSNLSTMFNVDEDGKTFIKVRPTNDYYWDLALGKYFTLRGSDSDESYLLHNVYYSSGWKYRESTTGAGANYIRMGGGVFGFFVADDGTQDETITWKQALSIAKTGVSTFGYAVTIGGICTASNGFVGPLTGNAATATKLATARTINGVAFDGSANITITAAPTAHTHTELWSQSHPSNYYIAVNWDGTYWFITSNHGSPIRVGYSDSSGNAVNAGNSDTVDGFHIGSRTNWNSLNCVGAVVGQLSWKNYGNDHTIFDASKSLSPDNTPVNSSNSDIAWTATYPTLMGWNGLNTYGVRVDSARFADSATKLATARTINGVDFDGSANINISSFSNEIEFTASTTVQNIYLKADRTLFYNGATNKQIHIACNQSMGYPSNTSGAYISLFGNTNGTNNGNLELSSGNSGQVVIKSIGGDLVLDPGSFNIECDAASSRLSVNCGVGGITGLNVYGNGTNKCLGIIGFGDHSSTSYYTYIQEIEDDYLKIHSNRVYLENTVIVGNPTVVSYSYGYLIAQAVYDDSTLLTKYVLDYYLNKESFSIDNYTREKSAVENFLQYADLVKDIDKYNDYININKMLPSFADIELSKEIPSIGKLAQRCWEELEIKTFHIMDIHNREKELELKVKELENRIIELENSQF